MDETTRSPAANPAPDPAAFSRAQAAASAVQALSRAARSLVLYEAGNETVLRHLSDYRLKMRLALEDHGRIVIAVAMSQLAVAGHMVYEERDREKSLAFRLYRDGIREVRIQPEVPWEELLAFLRIVAIRYAAVREQEEDTVTLLQRAEFRHIQVESVEGLTPTEELTGPEAEELGDAPSRARPPAGWDTPFPRLPTPVPLQYRPIPEGALEPLREERDEDVVEKLAVSLARDLLAEAMRGGWPMPNPDLTAFFAELRDALLIDGKLSALAQLVHVLAQAGANELRDRMLAGFGDRRTLEMLLSAVPEDADLLPPELASFMPLLGLPAALDRLAHPLGEGRRRLLVKIIVARLPRETDAVLARLTALPVETVRDLAEGIVQRAHGRAAELARLLLGQRGDALRLEGLRVLEVAEVAIPVAPLHALLRDPSDPVRARAAEVLGRRGDASTVAALVDMFDSDREVPLRMAEVAGRALAELAPIRAAQLFREWLDPRSRFLLGLVRHQRERQWAAVAGLGAIPGGEAEDALRALADKSDGELRRHCLTTLMRRRKGP